jgi:tetratricopeptide (TPR) repeat protein
MIILRAAVPLVLLLATGACRGAEPGSAPAGRAAAVPAQELAVKAGAAELLCRPLEAAGLYMSGAVAAARAAASAQGAASADAWAECEYLAEKACALGEATASRRLLVRQLEELARLTRPKPALSGRVTWRLGEALRAAGNEKAAAREFARLGFVTDWMVIGPFGNERGQGFASALPPESELVPDRDYPGRKRPVRWRSCPAPAADGLIDLAGMLRPDREAVAYLVTFFEVPGRGELPVAVRLGSADGVRVWVNGRELWRHDADREAGFDQDVFGAVLRPGWNSLLVKVGQADGSWGLRLRLTAPAGEPLEGLRCSPAMPRAPAAPFEGAPPPPDAGAADRFAERLRESPEDAAAMLRLGFLTARRGAFDRERGERPDRGLLARAAELRGNDARLWYELSFVSGYSGRQVAETDENPRRAALEKSLAAAPSAAAELELAAYQLRRYGNFDKTARHLARAAAAAPDALEIQLLETELADRRGDRAEAFAAAARLARLNPEDARAQRLLARQQEAAGNPAGAAEAWAAALKLDADDQALREAARLHAASGQAYRALEALAELAARRPHDPWPAAERSRLLTGSGDHAAAAAECRRALEAAPEDHRLLAELADCLDALGRRSEARQARLRALELAPGDAGLELYVEHLEGRPTYDRRHREDVVALLARAGELNVPPGEPAAYLLHKVIDRLQADGTRSRTVQVAVRILSERGAERFAVQRLGWFAGEQAGTVRTARVIRAAGGHESARILPEAASRRGGREFTTRIVQFPTPAVGDVVECEYRIDELEPGFFGAYFGDAYRFRRELPVLRARYVLIVPQGTRLHWAPVRCDLRPVVTEEPEDGATAYTWTAEHQPRLAEEPFAADGGDAAPAVQVATLGDWGSFGRWYWGLVHKQFEAGPLVRRKAAELAAGAEGEMGRIRAVHNFVVTDVRYVAWEFGVHGFKPYRAEQVLERAFGDCKDKAALICALLGEMGIRAHPALVRAERLRPRQEMPLPLIGHFNHCIVYVPPAGERPGLWLDGTAEHSGAGTLPDSVCGARAAVITPEGAELMDVPGSSASANTTSVRFVLSLAADGSASGEVFAAAGGDRGPILRQFFAEAPARARLIERLHGRRTPGATVANVGFSDLRDLDLPVNWTYGLTVPRLVRARGGLLELALPEDPLRGVLGYDGGDQLYPERLSALARSARRETDMALPVAWSSSLSWELALPPGTIPAELPPDVKLEGDFGRLVVTRRLQNGRLLIGRELSVTAVRIPAARYSEFRWFCQEVDRQLAVPVLLVKTAPAAARAGAGGGPARKEAP